MVQGRISKDPGADYLEEARLILDGLASEGQPDETIRRSDILRLLRSKHRAYREANNGFEGVLLDAVRTFDEKARQQSDGSILNKFSIVVTYLDRYDYVQKSIGGMIFNDEAGLTEDGLISLFGNKKVFDRLEDGLFYELFIRHHLENRHLTSFGREKLRVTAYGLERITLEKASFKDIVREFEGLRQ